MQFTKGRIDHEVDPKVRLMLNENSLEGGREVTVSHNGKSETVQAALDGDGEAVKIALD